MWTPFSHREIRRSSRTVLISRLFFFSSRRRHTRYWRDWSSDVCSSDLETLVRISKTHTVQRKLDAAGIDSIAENLRGLTEEEAERAISQALVTRYALCPEIATDVLEVKKSLLRRSEMLEFVEASDNMANVGGLENLKPWLATRRGAWEDSARAFGLEPPHRVIILGAQ